LGYLLPIRSKTAPGAIKLIGSAISGKYLPTISAVMFVEGSSLHFISMAVPPNLSAPIRAELLLLFSGLKSDRTSTLLAVSICLGCRVQRMSLTVGFHGIGG